MPKYKMPRIGCGLAGGTWDKIEAIINETLLEKKYRSILLRLIIFHLTDEYQTYSGRKNR